MRTYPKGNKSQVSKYFQAHEFDCRCTHAECNQTFIDNELMAKLDLLREKAGVPIQITDGNRCAAYQAELKARGYETAAGISQHELYLAADLITGKHSGKELEAFAREVGFKAVGTGKAFIHVDLRADKERRWTYSY